jgi:hypothetical protein
MLVAAALPSSALAFDWHMHPAVAGSGQVIHEERTVDGDFRALSLDTSAAVELRQGRPAAIEIEADDNVAKLIKVRLRDHTLLVSDERRYRATRAKVVITMPRVEQIATAGATALSAQGLVAPRLRIAAAGSSAISLAALTAEVVEVDAAGSAALKMAGIANDLHAELGGSAALQAREFETWRVVIAAGGSAVATVWAKEGLHVQAGGSAALRYRGAPQVTSALGGSATLGSADSAAR